MMAAPAWLVARPVAHRGLHDRATGIVENSPSAALAAIAGSFAIECDVQLTADGEAVVFHDFTLDRLTPRSGRVQDFSAATLAATPLRGTSDTIPALGAFLALIGGRVPLVCEIKSSFDGNLALIRRTVELARAQTGPVAIKSFDPDIVKTVAQLAPELPRGIVGESHYEDPEWSMLTPVRKHALANLLHYPDSRPDFLSWHVRDLETAPPFLARHAIGLPVMTWTVRTEEDRMLAAKGADQMVFEGFLP